MAGKRKKFEVPEQEVNGVRINKFLADAGVCSRREADTLIANGKVMIDGVVAEMGSRVFAGQKVTLNGIMTIIYHDGGAQGCHFTRVALIG